MSKIPHLFAWGDDGLPGEFKIYLKQMGGDDGVSQSDFMANGVVEVAERYRTKLQAEKDAWAANKKGQPPKLSHEIRSILYLLHAYCAHFKEPAPAALLWLTFEALDLQPNSPAREMDQLLRTVQASTPTMEGDNWNVALEPFLEAFFAKDVDGPKAPVSIPIGIEKLASFIKASALDGEADARGVKLTLSQLGRYAGVSRGRIRDWRKMPEYEARRRIAALAWDVNLSRSIEQGLEIPATWDN